jgi:hypothetical protein
MKPLVLVEWNLPEVRLITVRYLKVLFYQKCAEVINEDNVDTCVKDVADLYLEVYRLQAVVSR